MNHFDLKWVSGHLIIVLQISLPTAGVHKDNDIAWESDVDT